MTDSASLSFSTPSHSLELAKLHGSFVLAFDTSNEVMALGIGRLVPGAVPSVEAVASVEVEARRASNTQLLPRIEATLSDYGISRSDIACVACGRGPGSFTGVRIAMATAKGVASALGVPLVGVSSLDAVAWGAWRAGARGRVLVAADAMRKEVYPVRFRVFDKGVARLEADRVEKADVAAARLREEDGGALQVTGDALRKYAELFSPCGAFLSEETWTPTGWGLLLALQAAWRAGEADPLDARRHDPAFALPVYTRLSDAEENERVRLATDAPKNLVTGVQDVSTCGGTTGAKEKDRAAKVGVASAAARFTMHAAAQLTVPADEQGIVYRPLDAVHVSAVAAMECRVMGSDAWNEALVADELPRPDRIWWIATGSAVLPNGGTADAAGASGTGSCPSAAAGRHGGQPGLASGQSPVPEAPSLTLRTTSGDSTAVSLLGYAGGWVVDGQLQVLKVGVAPEVRRRGIARELLAHVAADARDLGASSCSLEVRAGNAGAQAFYRALGFADIGVRPRYYSDREDAVIMEGPLPLLERDVAGMKLRVDEARDESVPTGASARLDAGGTLQADCRPQTSSPHASPSDGEFPSSPSEENASARIDPCVRPLILAIESSCDETAAAIVDGEGNLVADVVASQIDFHARFGGVVPEIASRKHIEAICGVCDECLEVTAAHLGAARLNWRDLDAVAVTYAPGLVGALVVGVAFAKGAAWAAGVPFIGVNHLEGHLYANKIGAPDFAPPAVVSLVSGGNTLLVHMKGWGDYETLGATIDDAVGEAFDKVSKALGLGYPGGPAISREAARGNADAIAFPRAMLHSGDLRFSLSGLKTAVITYLNAERAAGREPNVADVCASFQQAVVDVQVAKAKTALEQTGAPTFCLGGGVAANPVLRAAYEKLCDAMGVRLVLPPLSACGDNAGMIALVALDRYRQGKFFPLDADAQAHANLDESY